MKNPTSSRPSSSSRSSVPAPCEGVTVGIDLGDRKHAFCALDSEGRVLEESMVSNNRESLRHLSERYPAARVIIEVGTHSPWISRWLEQLGHEVLVANAHKVRAIYTSTRKSDRTDAMMLARIGRMDPSLLHPVTHRGEREQRDLLHVRLRDTLVRKRVELVTTVRFTLKSLGLTLRSPGTEGFAARARMVLAEQDAGLLAMIEPLLQVLDVLTVKIRELDRKIEKVCEESYPQTRLLRGIPGVGPITSLAFVLTIGDPERFPKSRDVGAYFGLVPRRDQSGALDKQLRISKAGDAYLRRLLVGCAQYILGSFGPPSDLRTQGLKLAERGGRGAKNKAVVAVARRLAVLMHAMWSKSTEYRPLRAEAASPAAAAA